MATSINRETYESKNATAIKALAKTAKIPNWWTKKKGDLITEIMAVKPVEIIVADAEHDAITNQTEKFLGGGGAITECKPQKNEKREAPTQTSAELNERPRRKKKAKTASQAGEKKTATKRAPRIRDDENVVTLQSILDELDLAGPKARKILRATDIVKPGKQWVWPKGDKQIAIVKGALSLGAGLDDAITKSKKKNKK